MGFKGAIMENYVVFTERYETEAQKYNYLTAAKRFKAEVESHDKFEPAAQNRFGVPGNFFKRRSSHYRSLYCYKDLEVEGKKIRCIVALRFFIRSDEDYAKFYSTKTSEKDRERIANVKEINWEKYKEEIKEIFENRKPVEIPLPILTEAEQQYIHREGGITQKIFEVSIMESKTWVEEISNPQFKDHYKVAETLSKSIENAYNDTRYGFFEFSYGDQGKRILCYVTSDQEHWYLLKIGTAEQIQEYKDTILKNINTDQNDLVPLLDNISRRAYPYTMLEGDKDFWREMEMEQNSNFILSSEELNIVSNPIKFPLFLTGRAGSGKSTMLQYLFAEYLLRYLKNEGVKPPVYLSYSSNLIENAQKLATNLFTKNHVYTKELQECKKNFEDDLKPKFDNVFYVFHDLVKKCIEEHYPDVVGKKFNKSHYVSYAKFRSLWDRKFGRNKEARSLYGAAISWHVIRTYIKGWSAEDYLEPEGYQYIGSENKSVTDETFAKIYKNVWEEWYQPLQKDQQWWDDQDLIRYCLNPKEDQSESCVDERFSAIFCDEAQDFTQIEIDFILRLSSFSHRRIFDANTIYQLPFIFAGDEFQTLNPTGFSWNSLRSYFTKQLIYQTYMPNRVGAPEPITLQQNYRSAASIVRVANRLQLLRQTRCSDDKNYTPQIPYKVESKQDAVYCLAPTSPLVWDKLKTMGVVLIIPTTDGQSVKEYVQDSKISDMIDFYDDTTAKDITILNPTQAKGLEYPNVAIYGFDELPDIEIHNLNAWYANDAKKQEKNEAHEIELKYALSNAYVSATRAQCKLFILTEYNEKSFWTFAFSSEDPKLQNLISETTDLMKKRVKPDIEPSTLGYVIKGDLDAVTGENILNIEDIAPSVEKRALELQDPDLMRQAAARYREQNKEKKSIHCEAVAYRFDSQYQKAAEYFEKVAEYEEACEDYWKAGNEEPSLIPSVLNSICKLKLNSNNYKIRYADHTVRNISIDEFKLDLYELKEKLELDPDKRDQIIATNIMWSKVLGFILDHVKQPQPSQIKAIQITIDLVQALLAYDLEIPLLKLAKIVYNAKAVNDAIKLWEQVGKDLPKEYYKAKSYTLSYPENLTYIEQAGETNWQERIIDLYHNNLEASKHIDNKYKKIVAKVLLNKGEPQDCKSGLLFLLNHTDNLTESRRYIEQAKDRDLEFPMECINGILELRWGDISKVEFDKGIYASKDLNDLLATLIKIKGVRSKHFIDKFNDWVFEQKKPLREFLEQEFKNYKRQRWNWILFIEIGVILEKRGIFISAQRFYDWAINNTDDTDLQKELAIRWIVCKERQAKKDDNSEYWQEASDKRREYGVASDYEIPQEFKFTHWNELVQEVLLYSAAKAEKPKQTKLDSRVTNNRNNRKENDNKEKQPIFRIEVLDDKKSEKSSDNKKIDDYNANLSQLDDFINNAYKSKHKIRRDINSLKDRLKAELLPRIKENFEPKTIEPTIQSKFLYNKDKVIVINVDAPKLSLDEEKFKVFDKVKFNAWKESNESKKTEASSKDNGASSKAHEELKVQDVPSKKKLEEYKKDGYKFRFNPNKAELSISYEDDEEDLHTKIKDHEFPASGDFTLDGERLIKTESKEETPFRIKFKQYSIIVTHIPSKEEVKFKFER